MSAPSPVPVDIIHIAEASFRRCEGERFFQSFYQRLLGVSDDVRAKFAATDFARQNKLLQHGIGLLFSYAKRPDPLLLQRIAQRHSHADLDVPPIQYHHFTDGLVATVREFDPEFRPEVEDAWRQAMAPGIAYIESRYDLPTGERA